MAKKQQPKTSVVKVIRGFMYGGSVVPTVQGKDKDQSVIIEAPFSLARELIANGKAELTKDPKTKKNYDLPKPEDDLEAELDGK